MKTVNIRAAKTNLSALVEEAAAGKEIIIAKAGKPIARLMPLEKKQSIASTLGIAKGQIWISDDYNDPLPAEVLKDWGIAEFVACQTQTTKNDGLRHFDQPFRA